MKTAYIAGKVTGVVTQEELKEKFKKGALEAERLGFKAIVPTQLVHPTCTWETAMKICLSAMLNCDAVFFMSCTLDSPGATWEHEIAKRLRMQIFYI